MNLVLQGMECISPTSSTENQLTPKLSIKFAKLNVFTTNYRQKDTQIQYWSILLSCKYDRLKNNSNGYYYSWPAINTLLGKEGSFLALDPK